MLVPLRAVQRGPSEAARQNLMLPPLTPSTSRGGVTPFPTAHVERGPSEGARRILMVLPHLPSLPQGSSRIGLHCAHGPSTVVSCTFCEVREARNNEPHVCARRRDGEPAVSNGPSTYLSGNGTRSGPTAHVERAHSDRARSASRKTIRLHSPYCSNHPLRGVVEVALDCARRTRPFSGRAFREQGTALGHPFFNISTHPSGKPRHDR
jgi:hypothetical protein